MNKIRFVCANCRYIFDKDISLGKNNIFCPECGSNACDEYKSIVKKWLESPPIYYLEINKI